MYSEKMLQALNGMNPRQFLEQSMLADFVDGVGPLKWQSDQMTLNYWFKAKGIPVKKLNWKWNALYTAVKDISEAQNLIEQDNQKMLEINIPLTDINGNTNGRTI